MLRHQRLDEQRRACGVEPRAEPVGRHLDRVLWHLRGVEPVGEQVPVGGEVEALVRVLQRDPVGERPEVIPQVQPPARSHPRQHTLFADHHTFVLSQIFADRIST